MAMANDYKEVNALSRAYDVGYYDGYENGRTDVIDEIFSVLSDVAFGKRKGLIHMDDVRKALERIKKQNNG